MTSPRRPRISFRAGTVGFSILFAAIFGVALFLAIADIGFARIWDEVISVRFGLVIIVLVHLGQLLFCALGWETLFAGMARTNRPALPHLFVLRWIRESIDHLLPVAQVGG